MESITENELRIGNLTSSKAFFLCASGKGEGGFSAGCHTYIRGKNLERRFGISLSQEKYSRPTAWGHFLEQRVHDLLPSTYQSVGHITLKHPTIKHWAGSPDNKDVTNSICGDTKCYERLAFGEYVENLTKAKGDTEFFKSEHPEEYWQLVSNAIILGMKFIQPIVYMPYESEIEEIREEAHNYEGPDQWKFRFIAEAPLCELPYLKDDWYFKNLNTFLFEIPKADKDFLTSRMIMAGKYLVPFFKK